MALTDPIADMLTRVRNAAHAGHDTVSVPHSRLKASVARILQAEGFITDAQEVGEGVQGTLVITLKYADSRRPVFNSMERASKPGRRMYVSHRQIKPTRQGMGIAILTTPKGVMTDAEAKRQGVGGEIMCTVW